MNNYGLIKLFILLPLVAALAACEARLDLQGVEQAMREPVRRTDQLIDMTRVSDQQLVLVGNSGLVLVSSNNGGSWQRSELPGRPNLIDSDLCPNGAVVALAYERSLWVSTDQGTSWTGLPIPTEEDVQTLDCSPNGDVWVVGSFSTLLQSSDLGNSWQQQSLDEDAMLTGIKFFSATEGIAAGEFGTFVTTDDAGATWQRNDPISDEFFPLALHFEDLTRGWAGSLSGVIMHTNDGGRSWQRQETASQSPIYNFVAAEGALYALGDHGTVLTLRDNRWIKVSSPDIPVYLRTGVALGDRKLLVAGGWGTLFSLDPFSLDLQSSTDSSFGN